MKFYKQVKVRTNKTWNFVKKRIPVDKKLKKGEKEYVSNK